MLDARTVVLGYQVVNQQRRVKEAKQGYILNEYILILDDIRK